MSGVRLGQSLDRATRAFWRTAGRRVDLDGAEAWLRAPTHDGEVVGDGWIDRVEHRAGPDRRDLPRDGDGCGLIADMSVLDGPGFAAADLDPQVRDFYEHTSDWRMEVWTQWCGVFRPGGALVERLFGRRVQQLALPTRPMDVALGMDSRVVPFVDASGDAAAAWVRTLRSTGGVVYSGAYSARTLPGADRASVHVAFPLPAGNVQVFLRPGVRPDGSLDLVSGGGTFGADGAYVVVDERGRASASRAPVHERFHVYVDEEGILRTDHALALWSATVVRLHYKLTRS